VVVRERDEPRVGACLGGESEPVAHARDGRVRRAGNHGDSTIGRLDGGLDGRSTLLVGEAGELAGRPARDDPVEAGVDDGLDVARKCVGVEIVIGVERRHDRGRDGSVSEFRLPHRVGSTGREKGLGPVAAVAGSERKHGAGRERMGQAGEGRGGPERAGEGRSGPGRTGAGRAGLGRNGTDRG